MKEVAETSKKIDLSQYKELIETVCKVEFKKFSTLGLVDYSELINIGNYTVYYVLKNAVNSAYFNDAYFSNAIKWAIRNEIRRRYKWHLLRNQETQSEGRYMPLLSIDEIDASGSGNLIKDRGETPEARAQMIEIKNYIIKAISDLPDKEREILQAKFFYNKKLKDISAEFNLSPSRISRIIQFSLDKIKKDLLRRECG